jgi:hypothetical protein
MIRLDRPTLDGPYETPRVLGALTCAAKYGGTIRLRGCFNDGHQSVFWQRFAVAVKMALPNRRKIAEVPGSPISAWRFTAVRFF